MQVAGILHDAPVQELFYLAFEVGIALIVPHVARADDGAIVRDVIEPCKASLDVFLGGNEDTHAGFQATLNHGNVLDGFRRIRCQQELFRIGINARGNQVVLRGKITRHAVQDITRQVDFLKVLAIIETRTFHIGNELVIHHNWFLIWHTVPPSPLYERLTQLPYVSGGACRYPWPSRAPAR